MKYHLINPVLRVMSMSDSSQICRREAAEWMISMNLYRLLKGWNGKAASRPGYPSPAIPARWSLEASFCIKGGQSDGHDFAKAACEAGAAAVVVERDLGIPGQILVGNSRWPTASSAAIILATQPANEAGWHHRDQGEDHDDLFDQTYFETTK